MSTAHRTPATAPRRGVWQRIADWISRIPLRTRIGLLVMIAVGLSVSIAAGVNYFTVRRTVLQQVDQNVFQDASTIVANHMSGVYLGAKAFAVAQDGTVRQLLGSTDVGLSQFQNAIGDNSPEQQVADGSQQSSLRTVSVPGLGPYRVFAQQGAEFNGQPAALVVAVDMGPTNHTLSQLALSSLLVAFSGILLAGVAGFGIGRAGLRPVDRLTQATEHVARTGDLTPVEVQGQDELARLAVSFNSMLAALARSREYQRRLVADAGHELRTPLTSMRTNIDLLAQSFALAESGQLSTADRDELIGDVKAQLAELSMLVSDLVELSRDEPHPVVWQALDLADVVHAAAERVRRRAPGVRFVLRVEPWPMSGDPAALERAVTNLLDNAAKFSPPHGAVTVELHGGLLQVADEGPGIAESDVAHVFERFYRSPEARSAPGSGLGLAIVKQAVENHGGRVAAGRASTGGALLSAWLPGASGDRAATGNGATMMDVTPPTALPPGGASAPYASE